MKHIYLSITFCILFFSCETKNNKSTTETVKSYISTTSPTVNTQEEEEEEIHPHTETYLEDEYSQTNEYSEGEDEYYEYGEEYEEDIDIPICDEDLSDFVTNIYLSIPSSSGYENLHGVVPLILKNNKCNFPLEAYPYDIYFKVIPKVSDTLIVSIALNAEEICTACLETTTIESLNKGVLYYHISQNENIIAHNGIMENVLEEQDLSYSDIEIDDSFHNDYDFLSGTLISKLLETNFILNSDVSWKENSSITEIHKKITTSSKTTTNLDVLKSNYENFITPQEDTILDNLLSNEVDGYFHFGMFTGTKSSRLLLETINIIFISPDNKTYTVEWLKDREEFVADEYSSPLDDDYVTVTNGEYKINKWDNDTEISLFHPDMEYGDYLVIYEAKLKERDVYIQSPINIITYKKP